MERKICFGCNVEKKVNAFTSIITNVQFVIVIKV